MAQVPVACIMRHLVRAKVKRERVKLNTEPIEEPDSSFTSVECVVYHNSISFLAHHWQLEFNCHSAPRKSLEQTSTANTHTLNAASSLHLFLSLPLSISIFLSLLLFVHTVFH